MRKLVQAVVVFLGFSLNLYAAIGHAGSLPDHPPTTLHAAHVLLRVDAWSNQTEEQSADQFQQHVRTQEALIRSPSVLDRVIDDEQLLWTWQATSREEAARELADGLHIEPYGETYLISIMMRRPTAEEAVRLANAVADAFAEWRTEEHRKRVQRAVEALRKELRKLQHKLDLSEKVVNALIVEMGATSLNHTTHSDDRRLARLEADRVAAHESVAIRKSRLHELEALEGSAFMAAIAVVLPEVEQFALSAQLAETEMELRAFAVDDPRRTDFENKAARLRETIDEMVDALKKGLRADCAIAKARLGSLESELRKYREGLTPEFRKMRQALRKAEREAEVQQTIFNALRSRLARESVVLDGPGGTVEIVQRASHAVSLLSEESR